MLPLILREDRVDELARVVGGETRVLERLKNAVDADDGRVADAQMQVARAALQNLEKNVDNVHCCPLDHWPLTDILWLHKIMCPVFLVLDAENKWQGDDR